MNEENYYPDNLPMPPQPMPGQKSDDAYSQIIMQKKLENLLSQLDPDHLIIEIEYRLKGWRKNEYSGNWELAANKEKEISSDLLIDVVSLLSSILTNNTTMSNFQDVEINKLMAIIIKKLIDMIRSNSEKYGLGGDYSERDRVLLIICMSIFAALKRAQNGLEAKRILESFDIKESYQPQKKGVGEKLQFWK